MWIILCVVNRSNWIDGDGHTGIVFMASSYSTSQSPSQVSVMISTITMVMLLSCACTERGHNRCSVLDGL